MRIRSRATMFLQRAQLVFMLAVLVPTVLMTAIGILLVAARGSKSLALVAGILVLAFCATALTGWILGAILVTRGASLATVQNDFLSAVSHELRTPLTSIRLFIDTLREDRVTDPDERRRCLDIVNQELLRLDGLVSRLMNLSKIESGNSVFERKPVAVGDIITDALTAFGAVTIRDQLDLQVQVTPGLHVVGDRSALSQAVSNLLTNAWRYSGPQDRKIQVAATGDNHSVTISVSDNGPGIPAHEQKVIFDKFVRGSAANERPDAGTGLGLAIVRAIVQAHKGNVIVESEPPHGACFRITLPRATLVPS